MGVTIDFYGDSDDGFIVVTDTSPHKSPPKKKAKVPPPLRPDLQIIPAVPVKQPK